MKYVIGVVLAAAFLAAFFFLHSGLYLLGAAAMALITAGVA